MLAAQSGCRSITGLLLQRPDVFLNKQDDVGRTALHWACFNGHDDVAEMLLGHRKINRVLCDKVSAPPLTHRMWSNNLNSLFHLEWRHRSLPRYRFLSESSIRALPTGGKAVTSLAMTLLFD